MKTYKVSDMVHNRGALLESARNGGAIIERRESNGRVIESFLIARNSGCHGIDISPSITKIIENSVWVSVSNIEMLDIDSKAYIDGIETPLIVIAVDYDKSRFLGVADR